jgi:hypothetical protein
MHRGIHEILPVNILMFKYNISKTYKFLTPPTKAEGSIAKDIPHPAIPPSAIPSSTKPPSAIPPSEGHSV